MIPFKNLTMEESSYLYGLLITDGWLTSREQSGNLYYSIGLELSEKDKDIIYKLNKLIPESHVYTRNRDTNFKRNYICYSFNYTQQDLCNWLIEQGFPTSNKTINAGPPKGEYDENAFWRGVIDGDGSIGIRKTRCKCKTAPFISLVTKSELLRNSYREYVHKYTDFYFNVNRNKRDNLYNIVLEKQKCFKITKQLYQNATIFLDRKYQKYLETLKWKEEHNE